MKGRMNRSDINAELTYTSKMEKEEKVVCRHQMMSKRMNCKKVHPHNVVVSLFHKVCGKSLFINCFMRAKVLIICEIPLHRGLNLY